LCEKIAHAVLLKEKVTKDLKTKYFSYTNMPTQRQK